MFSVVVVKDAGMRKGFFTPDALDLALPFFMVGRQYRPSSSGLS
jgi:hypothetical protein